MALIDKLEKFAGKTVKPGRVVIKGFPVDIDDGDGSFISMDAVDSDAAKGLMKVLRAAKFKVKRDGNLGITISESSYIKSFVQIIREMSDAKEKEKALMRLDSFIQKAKSDEKLSNTLTLRTKRMTKPQKLSIWIDVLKARGFNAEAEDAIRKLATLS